ncbi:MetQ/NlpA family ABC transporter substrate-binding protein [Streptococcus massiliensis]|uniref:YaeC family protein n=1 Tax=Streptococcus massiliensis TaxID=313439 RepID=A0A380L1M8_9STRE|nr:MetQ/NlpA family ABC transporter substrate-binding protein [Streptococcus massiliensis]SUN77480.1 YaeC family protein [Streptococcus massiliensis]
MKKFFPKLVLAILALLCLIACSSQTKKFSAAKKAKTTDKIIRIAALKGAPTGILKLVQNDLEKLGYELSILQVNNASEANQALSEKKVDFTFAQDRLAMRAYNYETGSNLNDIQPIYNEQVAFYSQKWKTLDEIPNGTTVALPADTSEKTRALRLLAQAKLVELKDKYSYEVSTNDVTINPKNLQFKEIQKKDFEKVYQEDTLAFAYPTEAAQLKLQPQNGLVREAPLDDMFAIGIIGQEGSETPLIYDLRVALTNSEVRTYIQTKLKGRASIAFTRPHTCCF